MLVWDLRQEREPNNMLPPMCRLPHRGRTAIIEYNPRYNMIASADKYPAFWLPEDPARVSGN